MKIQPKNPCENVKYEFPHENLAQKLMLKFIFSHFA